MKHLLYIQLLFLLLQPWGQQAFGQKEDVPVGPFSIGPLVGFDFVTHELQFGEDDEYRVREESSAVLPQFGLQAMYRVGAGLSLLTEPAFGSFYEGTDQIAETGRANRQVTIEKFHVLHLPLLLRKRFSEEALTGYLIAGLDMMILLAPHASIRYRSGTNIEEGSVVTYEIPFSQLAIQAGIGVEWRRTKTLAITGDLRYRSLTGSSIGGELASVGVPAHFGLRIGLRVHFAPKKPF
ncbi:PorT family protein [bacterium]|nr:PorT family protein [bacterium]